MTRHNLPIGAIGTGLALAGMIGYTLAPDKLWLVTLCEALALLCLTWFFIAHLEQFKAFSTRRSTRAGAHSALVVMLFVGILIIVNFLAARHSVRWDLSENQNYTLAPETHRVLRGLPGRFQSRSSLEKRIRATRATRNGWTVIGKPAIN